MIAHLLLYSNKVFCINHRCFPCKFLFLFLFLCQTNIQQVKYMVWLRKPMYSLFNDYLFTIDNINTLRQSINFVSACFT